MAYTTQIDLADSMREIHYAGNSISAGNARFPRDRIAFTPPLIMTETEIAEMCRRFGQGLDAAWRAMAEESAVSA